MGVLQISTTADVLLLYPGDLLKGQIDLWAVRHPDRKAETSSERSLPKIRTLLRRAAVALVDATEDPGQATDAFLQAVARLGAGAVAMYTEVMHDDLELFVRLRGSLLLFGPLLNEHWEDYFERLLRTNIALPAAHALMPRQQSPYLTGSSQQQRSRFINRFRAGFDWPVIDAY